MPNPQTPDQPAKGRTFRDLHHRPHAFIVPNPWDGGTARLLAQLGFEALATTSAGFAFTLGQADNTVSRSQMMSHLETIVAATPLPVSADLENGFGDSPDNVAETIRLAAEAGVVGGSIEDATARSEDPIYALGLAVDRISAAAAAAHSLPFPFTLTARCENYLVARPDLADTIRRLQAYQEAGADVLYAPGLSSRDEIAAVVRSVDRPVNVVMGLKGAQLDIGELNGLGVRRVSVGSALARTALGAFHRAAVEMRERGTFSFAVDAMGMKELCDRFKEAQRSGPVA